MPSRLQLTRHSADSSAYELAASKLLELAAGEPDEDRSCRWREQAIAILDMAPPCRPVRETSGRPGRGTAPVDASGA